MAQGSGLRIRKGSRRHIEAAARIAAAAVAEGSLPTEWDLAAEKLRAANLFVVAVRHGHAIGFLTADEGEGGSATVSALAVLPTSRGRGVGTALLEAARAEVGEAGRVILAATDDEQLARLFRRAGVWASKDVPASRG